MAKEKNPVIGKWRGYPLKDANRPYLLILSNADIANGQRKQFEACAIYHGAMRQMEAREAKILKTVAYIVHRDDDGSWVAHRYHIGPKALKVIVANDKGEVLTSRSVVLSAQRPSQQLAQKRKRIANWRAATPAAKRGGKSDGRGRGDKNARKPLSEIRNGTGQYR